MVSSSCINFSLTEIRFCEFKYTTIIYSESRTILCHLISIKLNLFPPKNWSNMSVSHTSQIQLIPN
ncbi:hypothetical protein ACS0TY_020538 [Phlomoides rotata]